MVLGLHGEVLGELFENKYLCIKSLAAQCYREVANTLMVLVLPIEVLLQESYLDNKYLCIKSMAAQWHREVANTLKELGLSDEVLGELVTKQVHLCTYRSFMWLPSVTEKLLIPCLHAKVQEELFRKQVPVY